MKRSEFIAYLSVLPLLGILGCSSPTQTKPEEQFMGEAKGKSGATATVEYKVVGKDGNVKYVGKESHPVNQTKKED